MATKDKVTVHIEVSGIEEKTATEIITATTATVEITVT
jgi:hypothetical protein